ncbi:hypothetical protein D3C81_2167270 [compost metagenome]
MPKASAFFAFSIVYRCILRCLHAAETKHAVAFEAHILRVLHHLDDAVIVEMDMHHRIPDAGFLVWIAPHFQLQS